MASAVRSVTASPSRGGGRRRRLQPGPRNGRGEQHGRLDILVNSAGITIDKTVLKLTDEDWYKVIAVNLSGAFFMSQAALPHMIERGPGQIVNISSSIGEMGDIGQAAGVRCD